MSDATNAGAKRDGDATKNEVSGAQGSPAPKQDAEHSDHKKQQNENRQETGMEEHWTVIAKELRDTDEALVKNVNDSIDSLLLFAGLFSAVQSAFAVATYPLLQPRPLRAVDATINIFVFSSLAVALICAFVGILRKNQLKQHFAWTSMREDARSQIVNRQFSFELNSTRMLWDSARHISLGLTLSITLFAVGVFVLLWSLCWFVALAVFLFAFFTLCVIFSGDIPFYYRRLRGRMRAMQRRLYLASSGHCLTNLLRIDEDQVYAGLRPLGRVRFGLLSRAIMSRTSGLTASDVAPALGRHLAQGIIGLGRLPDITDVLKVLTPKEVVGARNEHAEFQRNLDIILAIIQDRDPLNGSLTLPLSFWCRFQEYVASEKTRMKQRDLRWPVKESSKSVPERHTWLTWLPDALLQFSTEEKCLLADIVSDQITLALDKTKPLRETVPGLYHEPEEPLYSAFCLACVMWYAVPSNLQLRWAIALAGVRLQFSNLPSGPGLTSTGIPDLPGHESQVTTCFVEWGNKTLQRDTNLMMAAPSVALFRDDLHHPGGKEAEELAVNTFLQAALSTNVTSLLSELSELSPKEHRTQCSLFLISSAHALCILRTRYLNSAGSAPIPSSDIRRLGVRLTELLRHDLLRCLPETDTPLLNRLATADFPWHTSLEHFVEYFPAEMGALLRYLVREDPDKKGVSSRGLDRLAARFPPHSKADHNLLATISQHLAMRSDSVHRSSVALVEISRHQDRLAGVSAGLEHNGQTTVHASDAGRNERDPDSTSPHQAIDMDMPT